MIRVRFEKFLFLVLPAFMPPLASAQPHAVPAGAIEAQRASVDVMRAAIEQQRAAAAVQAGAMRSRLAPRAPLAAPGPAEVQSCARLPEDLLATYIAEAADRQELPPVLLRAVIERESGFQPCAVSDKGAMGLMQLMPETAAGLGVQDPFDPRENIGSGARFLRLMLSRFGNLTAALAAYHAGPARVEATGGLPPYPVTAAYVEDILARANLATPD